MLKSSFQRQLIHHRQAYPLTQEQLGRLIGVEKQCISNYEQGARLPDLATLTQLGEVFNQDLFISGQDFLFVEKAHDF